MVNNDTPACSASTFRMAITTLPGSWSANLSSTTLSLSPGATASSTLLVSSSASATAGSYSVQIAVSDNNETLHSKNTVATYLVNEIVPIEDSEAPTTPTGLAAIANFKQVSLTWNASNDNVGVTGYQVYRDGIKIADIVDTSYVDAGGADGVNYNYAVTAYDTTGNISFQSNSVITGKTIKGKGKGGSNGKGKK